MQCLVPVVAAGLVFAAPPPLAPSASGTGSLLLVAPAFPPDASPAPGYQLAVELQMQLAGTASGFAAFVEYDTLVLAWRGDLSSFAPAPFPLHISPLSQADDGLLELDGSVGLGDPGTSAGALLATLVFDVLAPDCAVEAPASFELGGFFGSELSHLGLPLPTSLLDAGPASLDGTPPMLFSRPADIAVPSDVGCAGAVVSFTPPTATDGCDAAPVVACTPPSGSLFPVGTTTVSCTATDANGNDAECEFDVIVSPTNLVSVTLELPGVNLPVTRCIHFQTSACASGADQALSFTDHDFDGGAVTPVRVTALIEVPCGTLTSLCAKDRQHTGWAGTGLLPSFDGTTWIATSMLSLPGGDTDDDGDVDINDVTWFLGQFGDLAAASPCPYTGAPRDADFSTDGAVLSEDYAFLVANWLMSSGCSCALTAGGGPPPLRAAVVSALQVRADLDGNGWVDVRDVELFEARQGLPSTLSAAMRASGAR